MLPTSFAAPLPLSEQRRDPHERPSAGAHSESVRQKFEDFFAQLDLERVAFLRRMAIRVSTSGGCVPRQAHSKRETERCSRFAISDGGALEARFAYGQSKRRVECCEQKFLLERSLPPRIGCRRFRADPPASACEFHQVVVWIASMNSLMNTRSREVHHLRAFFVPCRHTGRSPASGASCRARRRRK